MPTAQVHATMIRAISARYLWYGICLFLWTGINTVRAQDSLIRIEGIILEKGPNQTEIPLFAAKVGSDPDHFTFTGKSGEFELNIPAGSKRLMIRHDHIGVDTILITDPAKRIQLIYPLYQKMKGVKIRQKRFSTEITLLTPIKVEKIGSKELLKAACCNLGESFETTPSVDVAFTDAITGYRQIQLLGLAGPYTLITRENIPEVRGLASITGLSFTPGQWIEGMQLSKGSGSVVNGYEGLAGQINVEWRKPMEGDRLFLNLYQSTQGRTEANVYTSFEPVEGLYGNVFVHGKSQWLKVDQNHDHYMDQPLEQNAIVANRWMWFGKNGRELQIGARYVQSQSNGGSMHFKPNEDAALSNFWGMRQNTSRLDSWAKLGKLFKEKPWKSMGLQLAFSSHQQDMQFSRKRYDAGENSFYANYIFQSIVGHTGRVIKMGATFNHLERTEHLTAQSYHQQETVGGVFTEYSHQFSQQWSAVLGYRLDYHALYGVYHTPRLHVRYAPVEDLSIRGSIGKAYRTASVFSENLGLFATNREVVIQTNQADGFYGLKNEEALNVGINATYAFELNYRKGTLSSDYYYTRFQNQVVVDWEDARRVSFYHSSALSYAHSFQLQLDYELIRKMDVRLAYRFHNVMMTYGEKLRQKPLNARHRAFVNLAYETRSKWGFDYTLQWIGPKRLPDTRQNPETFQLEEYSPSFVTMNIHFNKKFKNGLEAYAGVENILNYMQMNPIVDASNPFGEYFDASMVWGPAMGRNIYVGLRYSRK